MTSPLLEIERLQLQIRSTHVPVVHGVSAKVMPGSMTALVGESGSGKTLTALAAIGLLPPAIHAVEGSIRITGKECAGLSQQEWREIRGQDISMVFQEPMTALDPVFTIGELFEGVLAMDGCTRREARQRGLSLLEEVKVPDPIRCLRSAPHQLSGGMRQRVVLALALARSPSVLLADEPTTALDVQTQEAVMELLQELCGTRGLGVLLVTHDLGLVARRAQQVVVIHRGHVCESGTSECLLRDPRHPYTRGLLASQIPVDHYRADLGLMEDVLNDPESWTPQESQEGPVKPWRPSEGSQVKDAPRLVAISENHFIAV